jgi:hypothetical protein
VWSTRFLKKVRTLPTVRMRLVGATLLIALLLPVSGVHAAVLDGDVVGGVSVGAQGALRSAAPDLYIPSGQLSTIDGRELWARDMRARRAMASTTKMMTAVVVLENASLDDLVTVKRPASAVGESSMGLRSGETISVRDLLEGLLIQSGNDAAAALAQHVGGSVDGFVGMMNAKAKSLDLVNTRYLNPHGLDVPGHYTSAEDLTSLARYAMRDPEFRRIVGTFSTRIVTPKYTHQLTNHNLMLRIYRGASGLDRRGRLLHRRHGEAGRHRARRHRARCRERAGPFRSGDTPARLGLHALQDRADRHSGRADGQRSRFGLRGAYGALGDGRDHFGGGS